MNFPKIEKRVDPKPGRKMSLEEYVEFCDVCLKVNRQITPENCLQRGEGIQKKFTLRTNR